MKPYADTNFFTALICGGPHAAAAGELSSRARNAAAPPFPVTFLGRIETANAFEQQVFLTRNGVPGVHSNPESALVQEAFFLDELQQATVLCPVSLPEAALEAKSLALAHRHTAKHGFRTYDLMHVASALLLGCDTFWSFDDRAKKLARLEGLRTN